MRAQVENIYPVGVIAQLVERRVRNAEVWSSILHGSTTFFIISNVIFAVTNITAAVLR